MKINAYVLAGDPAWAAQSIHSYYHLVNEIVVSFDRSRRSWAGHPLSVDESLARIATADPEGKVRHLPGDHVDPNRYALRVETEQRQIALDAASAGADWVIQLDTDEIVRSPGTFREHIRLADSRAADAVEFPSRLLHVRTKSGQFLERCGRWWQTQSAYPGPLAVRAGTKLTLARQSKGIATHRVDVRPWNTDPVQPRGVPVHGVIRPADAVVHLSWVRTEAQMAEKRVVSGHARDRDWERDIRRWRAATRHPWLTTMRTPLMFDRWRRFRLTRIPELADVET
ncbi:hypothetical protein [Microbacterium sp.]|uniref:hypothetical protein n=1 Tax=Microbacterium sp. TaxID=51671 RepID=UPI0037C5B216